MPTKDSSNIMEGYDPYSDTDKQDPRLVKGNSAASVVPTKDSAELRKSKVDWSTPYDSWLIPILNRARHAGPIEFRALPSEIQLEFDKVLEAHTAAQVAAARLDELEWAVGNSSEEEVSMGYIFNRIKELKQRLAQLRQPKRPDHEH